MIKSLLRKLKTKRSPIDCSDFIARGAPPSLHEVWSAFDKRYAGADLPAEQLELTKQRMVFDVKYRCGSEGRCIRGDYRCRFPCCFYMRPSIKGGEVFMERYGMEERVKARHGDIVELSRHKDQLGAAVASIDERLSALRTAAGGDFTKAAPTVTEQAIDLAVFRAVLQVNMRADTAAVDGLLRFAELLNREQSYEVIATAASWAALNDMEARFYTMHAKQYPDFEYASVRAAVPLLLARVVAVADAQKDATMLRHIVHPVLSHEVTAAVTRAQNAQEHGDATEDPMATTVTADSFAHYRHSIGGEFWNQLFQLLMMPQLDPRDNPPELLPGETPKHVLDALGRSMILHHVAAAIGPLPDEKGPISPAALESMPKEQRIAVRRMQELLNVVKNYSGPQPAGSRYGVAAIPPACLDVFSTAARGLHCLT